VVRSRACRRCLGSSGLVLHAHGSECARRLLSPFISRIVDVVGEPVEQALVRPAEPNAWPTRPMLHSSAEERVDWSLQSGRRWLLARVPNHLRRVGCSICAATRLRALELGQTRMARRVAARKIQSGRNGPSGTPPPLGLFSLQGADPSSRRYHSGGSSLV
jgi:hypothetical protein